MFNESPARVKARVSDGLVGVQYGGSGFSKGLVSL